MTAPTPPPATGRDSGEAVPDFGCPACGVAGGHSPTCSAQPPAPQAGASVSEQGRGGEVYQVEADYPLHGGGSWTWRKRYFSKRAASRQAQRRREGWTYDAIQWDEDDVVVEPATAVRVLSASIGVWSETSLTPPTDTRNADGAGS